MHLIPPAGLAQHGPQEITKKQQNQWKESGYQIAQEGFWKVLKVLFSKKVQGLPVNDFSKIINHFLLEIFATRPPILAEFFDDFWETKDPLILNNSNTSKRRDVESELVLTFFCMKNEK